jgi:hypothetical protein
MKIKQHGGDVTDFIYAIGIFLFIACIVYSFINIKIAITLLSIGIIIIAIGFMVNPFLK